MMLALLQSTPAAVDKTHLFTPLQAIGITAPTLLLGIYYFVRAKRVGMFAVLTFLVSIAYGLCVELLDIRTTETYFYTDLLLMLGRDPNWMPFSVGVSWACLMFVMMTTSDRLGLPVPLRPLLDGAMAVSVDFVMDPVASASVLVPAIGPSCAFTPAAEFGGMGLWTWCVPVNAPALWFTVPVSNFIGWFLVVSCFSAAVRYARGPLRAESRPLLAQLAILVAVAAVAGFLVLCSAWAYPNVLAGGTIQWVVLWTLFLTPIVAVFILRDRLRFDTPLDRGLLALPAVILVSEVGTFFWKRIDHTHWPVSALQIVGFALLSAALLLLPYWRAVARGSVSAAPASRPER
jgi:hypothetical protein